MDSPGTAPEESHRERSWALPVFLTLWTVLAIAALYLLLRLSAQMASSPPVVVHASDAAQVSFAQKARDWLMLAHLNFARIYPWVLFAPFVLWLASRFHLERERFKIHLPVLLAGGALFALGTHAINNRLSFARTRVVLFTSEQQTSFDDATPGARHSKMMKVEVTGASAGGFMASDEFLSSHQGGGGTGLLTHAELTKGFTNGIPTDLLPKLEEAMKPPMGRAAGLTVSPLAATMDVMAYGSLAGLAHAVLFYGRYRERERKALSLESSLSRARLSALQAQLQPHFLFNTLNAIATLLRRDLIAAEATLLALSDLLRLSLNQSETQEIPLREELRFLDRYLEIQHTRFGDRLRVEQEVDPAVLDCLVPTLILQPLVENAIRHGLEPSDAPGLIRIQAQAQKSSGSQNGSSPTLILTIEDNGVGFSKNSSPAGDGESGGIGLANLRTRLEALYASHQSIAIRPGSERGVIVKIELPWRAAGAERTENGRAGTLTCASS